MIPVLIGTLFLAYLLHQARRQELVYTSALIALAMLALPWAYRCLP